MPPRRGPRPPPRHRRRCSDHHPSPAPRSGSPTSPASSSSGSPPAAAEPGVLQRIIERMRAIPSLLLTEQVTSGPGTSPRPIGYRVTGRYLIASELYGAGAVDVRPIARTGDLTELAFALPGSSI